MADKRQIRKAKGKPERTQIGFETATCERLDELKERQQRGSRPEFANMFVNDYLDAVKRCGWNVDKVREEIRKICDGRAAAEDPSERCGE
jgi:hypothetical protein